MPDKPVDRPGLHGEHGIAGVHLVKGRPELSDSRDGRPIDRVHDVAGREAAVAGSDRPHHSGRDDHAGSDSSE